MPRINESVIKAMAKVLKEQFNIRMDVVNGKFRFYDLKSKESFKRDKTLVHYPDVLCTVEDTIYRTEQGKLLRCVEGSYTTGSGDMTVIVVEGNNVWRIYGDNYPRDNKDRTINTPIDCPHIVLSYQGKKEEFNTLYDSRLFKNDNSEFVEMVTKTPDIIKELSCDISLARFYIFGSPVVHATTYGTFVDYDNDEIAGPLIKESDRFDSKTIKDLIRSRMLYSYDHRDWIDKDILKKKIDFLVGRVDEYIDYINAHREEILARIDELATTKEEKRNHIIQAATEAITEANNSYRDDLEKIGEGKKVFQKTFPSDN